MSTDSVKNFVGILERLREYLLRSGYPEESVRIEVPVGNYGVRRRVDILVMGVDGSVPVAIFEAKSTFNGETIERAYRQLRDYRAQFKTPVMAYAALPSPNGDGWVILDATKYASGDEVHIPNVKNALEERIGLPTYAFLTTGYDSKRIQETYQEFGKLLEKVRTTHDEIVRKQKNAQSLLETLRNLQDETNVLRGKIGQMSEDAQVAQIKVMALVGEVTAERDGVKKLADNFKADYSSIVQSLESARGLGEKEAERIKVIVEGKLTDYLKTTEGKVDGMCSKLRLIQSSATTDALSREYSKKRNFEIGAMVWHSFLFVLALGLLICLAAFPIGVCWKMGKSFDEAIKVLPRLYLFCLPFSAPLLWFAFFENRRFNQAKQLKEQYVHKCVFGRTYTGLSSQIKELEESGDPAARDLMVKLLESTIRVYERDAAELLSKGGKSDMPVVEAVGEATRALHAAAEVVAAVKKPSGSV